MILAITLLSKINQTQHAPGDSEMDLNSPVARDIVLTEPQDEGVCGIHNTQELCLL